MKIRRKIFITILGISLTALILSVGVRYYQLSQFSHVLAYMQDVQSKTLTQTNLENLTVFNEDMVTSLALIYSGSMENKFYAVAARTLAVRYFLQDAYANAIETHTRFPDRRLNLAAGVSFADVEEEYRAIRSVRDIIAQIHAGNPAAWLFFASESGMFIDDEEDRDYRGYDFRNTEWYEQAARTGEAFWSQVRTDTRTGELEVCIFVPVFGPDGAVMGVVGSDLLLDYLENVVLNVDTDIIRFTFFVDEHGYFLFGSESGKTVEDFIPDPETHNALYTAMMQDFEGVRLFSQGDTIVGFAHIPSTNWRVGVLVDYERINRPIAEMDYAIQQAGRHFSEHIFGEMYMTGILFALIVVIITLVTVFISREITDAITQPIEVLTEGVAKVSAGDLEYKIDVRSGNEFQELAESFNAMTGNLRGHIAELLDVTTEKERISTELNIAAEIQTGLLPGIFPAFPEHGEFDIYASALPAKEVGGDFYDFFFVDDNTLAVVIADVSGKGIPAALFMVVAKTLIKNNAMAGKSPEEVFDATNKELCENNKTGMFVTAILGYLHIPTGRFTFVNAGHNPPLVSGVSGAFSWLKTKPQFFLGGMDDTAYTQHEVTLQKGSALLMYTDGVTEAIDRENSMFGEKRLLESANLFTNRAASAPPTPKDLARFIKSELDTFANGAEQADDITMLALRYGNAEEAAETAESTESAEPLPLAESQITVPANTEGIQAALDFAEAQLAGQPPKLRGQIGIVIDEIVSNVAKYAYGGETGSVTMKLTAAPAVQDAPAAQEIEIVFEDNGKAFNPLVQPEPDISAPIEEREPGGLGIFMVKNLMDSAEYRREGGRNVLVLKKG